MAASPASLLLRLQCVRMPMRGVAGGKVILEGVSRDMMIQGLQLLLQDKLGVPVARQLLQQSGIPPIKIPTSDAQATLYLLDIKNGQRIEVHEADESELEAVAMAVDVDMDQPGSFSSFPPKQAVIQGQGGWKLPSMIDVQRGSFERVITIGDNSCLFYSVSYVCEADAEKRSFTKAKTRALRRLAADVVASSPNTFTTAFLGMPTEVYQAQVLDPNAWGGFIELSIFSRHFDVEIVAFDPRYLREDVYGSHDDAAAADGEGHKQRVFLLYVDGRHYDALAWQPSSTAAAAKQTLFSVKDDNAWARVRDFCLSMHQELARQGKCDLQTQWRTNNHLKKTTAQNRERMRQERVAADAAQVQVVRDTTQALEEQQKKPPQETGGDADSDDAWTCATCTFQNHDKGSHCAVCGSRSPLAATTTKATTVESSGMGFACTTCTAWNETPDASRCSICHSRRDGGHDEHDDRGDNDEYGEHSVREPLPQTVDQLLGPPMPQREFQREFHSHAHPTRAAGPPAARARAPRRVLPRWACIHCTTSNVGSAYKCRGCNMRNANL